MDRREPPLADQLARLSREIRDAIGWPQRELARRADVSQTLSSRLERGEAGVIPLATVERVIEAYGARATITFPRTDARRDQRDPAHARCSAYIRSRLEAMGYIVHQELEIGEGTTRGWIDLVGYHPPTRVLHLGEVKTEVRDVGGI